MAQRPPVDEQLAETSGQARPGPGWDLALVILAMILAAIVVIAILTLLGPAVGGVDSSIINSI